MDNKWIQTFTGRRFWPLNPKPEHVFIEDIAHQISQKVRYTGACEWLYSVGQHSILMAREAPQHMKLRALMHDASEAYLPDVARPIKDDLPGFREIENRVLNAIFRRFDIPNDPGGIVKTLDNRILVDEKMQVMKDTGLNWVQILGCEPLGVAIKRWEPEYTERLFLKMFYELKGDCGLQRIFIV